MTTVETPVRSQPPARRAAGTAFGSPRDFLGNRFVYAVVSPRARGLSIGVNLNPDRECNFDCAYCEVDRHQRPRESRDGSPSFTSRTRRPCSGCARTRSASPSTAPPPVFVGAVHDTLG